jgi:hypothetical protein
MMNFTIWSLLLCIVVDFTKLTYQASHLLFDSSQCFEAELLFFHQVRHGQDVN